MTGHIPRSLRSVAVAAALVTTLSGLAGCALEDGRGWATVSGDVAGVLAASDGVLETDQGYTVALSAAGAHVLRLELLVSGAAAVSGPTEFDPANPPAGYTLCHGGHCHNVDGSLESYEEIAAKLAGGDSAVGEMVAASLPADAALDIFDGAPLPLGSVETDSLTLTGVALVLDEFGLSGTVSTTDGERQLSVTVALPQGLRLRADAAANLGRDGDSKAHVALTLTLPGDLLDGVRFDNLAVEDGRITIDSRNNSAVAETLAARLALLSPTATME